MKPKKQELTAAQVSMLKRIGFRATHNLKEIFKVTEWRSGCVYKTKSLGYVINPAIPDDKNYIVCNVSTSVMRQLF